eukprot:gnl/TRDRNA2_/TRDRNA2_101265_c4_seq1.p1 gnl/TRDRNA2_/TRDRNA2_101265_c4~~gnl/TRDRNA2_/TRDRNA2_101265_c4_seq1.p1  ORF type:complete len:248 (+),score=47.03 gnl/TRDRNA2_/TRDRNA2_101265_c4_seq1:1-744(+)
MKQQDTHCIIVFIKSHVKELRKSVNEEMGILKDKILVTEQKILEESKQNQLALQEILQLLRGKSQLELPRDKAVSFMKKNSLRDVAAPAAEDAPQKGGSATGADGRTELALLENPWEKPVMANGALQSPPPAVNCSAAEAALEVTLHRLGEIVNEVDCGVVKLRDGVENAKAHSGFAAAARERNATINTINQEYSPITQGPLILQCCSMDEGSRMPKPDVLRADARGRPSKSHLRLQSSPSRMLEIR